MVDFLNAEYIGKSATFFIPSGKVGLVSNYLHDFFILNYNAYTRESSDIQGFWRNDPHSPIFDDHNVKYVVSFDGEDKTSSFIDFLSDVCWRLDEQALYLTLGNESYLVRPKQS